MSENIYYWTGEGLDKITVSQLSGNSAVVLHESCSHVMAGT